MTNPSAGDELKAEQKAQDDWLSDHERRLGLLENTPPVPPVPPVDPPIDPDPPVPPKPPVPGHRRFGCNPGFKVDKSWSTDKPDAPRYNAILKPVARCLRFMDWWKTNDDLNPGGGITDEQKDLLDRQIDLCNELGSAMYLCLLFHDTPETVGWKVDRITQRLNPNLTRYIEWANEPWNSGTAVNREIVKLAGPIKQGSKTRAAHIGDNEFQQVWADHASAAFKAAKAADPDCVTVLGCLTANPWIAKKVERKLTTQPDAHGLTFYFGTGLGGTPPTNTSVDDILASSNAKITGKEIPRMRDHAAFSKSLGRRIIGYEGGPHYTIDPKLHQSHANVWRAMNQANRDPRIIPLCERMASEAERLGYEQLCWFDYLTPYNQWGSWGLGEDLDTIEQAEKYKYAAGAKGAA